MTSRLICLRENRPVEMTVDEGLKYIVSGGVYSPGAPQEAQLARMPVVDLTLEGETEPTDEPEASATG